MAEEAKLNDCLGEASFATLVDSDDLEEYEDDDDDDEEEEEEAEEENSENKVALRHERMPLDFSERDGVRFPPQQQSDFTNYEALAERKRKTLTNHQNDGSVKKPRVEDSRFPEFDELMTQMKLRKQRKPTQLKRRGRPKGWRKNLTPEVHRKLGEANVYYALGQYKDAIHVLLEVVKLAPDLIETYHTLGLVYEKIGDMNTSLHFYSVVVSVAPVEYRFLWKRLSALFLRQGNTGRATFCLDKAIKADPGDTDLKHIRAKLYVELGDYSNAAELYHQIMKAEPGQIEACKMAAKMYQKSNQVEQSTGILEDYIKNHPGVDISIIGLLVTIHMENSAYAKAIQQIELARDSQNQLPIELTVKAAICHVHMGNTEEAVTLFNSLQMESVEGIADLLMEVAEVCMNCGHGELALKYFLKLEGNNTCDNGYLHLRIAKCHVLLMKKENAITCLYNALSFMEDNIDIRETLASLLIEEGKDAEAIKLLSPPEHLDPTINRQSRPWWDCGRIKKQLAHIYLAKGMIQEFVDVILPPVSETLNIESTNQKFGPGIRLPKSVLSERAKVLDRRQDGYILHGSKPLVPRSELTKGAYAKKTLRRKEALKEERRAATLAAGLEWHSDDSDEENLELPKEPPLPSLLKDNDHFQLIVELCKALTSLRRYKEASKIIRDTREVSSRAQRSERKDILKSLESHIAYNANDWIYDHAETRTAVQRRPKSITAWNYYYKIRMNKLKNKSKFLNLMVRTNPECVPALIISGNRWTMTNRWHKAARDYLKAYKLQPDNPLINLSAGTALINLAAFGLRVGNRHQCLAQGFAFLYNNLRLCGNSQEALYNIARACHHVGLVTLAAMYYEKVLSTHEKDYPIPKLMTGDSDTPEVQKRGYCNLRREAAHNLHLIYKTSGAVDLARQVLRCHCTP